MKQAELIFVPAPAVGHLVSAIEFAKSLLDHDDRILVTILLMKLPITPYIDAYAKSLTASQPLIQLLDLPQVELPPSELLSKSPETYICDFIDSHVPHVKSIVKDIISSRSAPDSVQVAGLVLDHICVSMIGAGNEIGLPSYVFLSSNASFLGLQLYLVDHHHQISTESRIFDSEFQIPGFINLVPPRVLPPALFNKDGYATHVKVAQRLRDAKGIIVNTFAELESSVLKSFLDDGKTPSVYPVGPLLNLKDQAHPDLDHAQREKIMKWLDEQPQSSVLFLCFGSVGSFGAAQVKEIALGLERSGCRFLWSMRVPRSSHLRSPEEMLPEGFLDQIGGRGMTCGWAPQVEVLSHGAVGGFVSHCGWNSILESLWHGVPILTWPIYAEQQFNAFMMVRELGLAMELKLDSRMEGELVVADEISRAVRRIMQGADRGTRMKLQKMREMGKQTLMEGGSSFNSVDQLIKDVMPSHH